MGARLVGLAYVFAASHPLKPNEMRLLTWMALKALDTDAVPRYFMARESSAFALGRRVPDAIPAGLPNWQAIEAERNAAFDRVKVTVRGLVKAGAIHNIKRGREGQRAEYALTLTPVDKSIPVIPRGSENDPLQGSENDPLAGSESDRQGGRNPTPQGTTEEPQEEQGPGRTFRPSLTALPPVDNRHRKTA